MVIDFGAVVTEGTQKLNFIKGMTMIYKSSPGYEFSLVLIYLLDSLEFLMFYDFSTTANVTLIVGKKDKHKSDTIPMKQVCFKLSCDHTFVVEHNARTSHYVQQKFLLTSKVWSQANFKTLILAIIPYRV